MSIFTRYLATAALAIVFDFVGAALAINLASDTLRGAEGERGATGPAGPRGITGAPGAPGTGIEQLAGALVIVDRFSPCPPGTRSVFGETVVADITFSPLDGSPQVDTRDLCQIGG